MAFFIQFPHLAIYIRILRVIDEDWTSQTVESIAAEGLRRVLAIAVNLEELYYPNSSNGAHGEVFQSAKCFRIRVLRCHFRGEAAEHAICDFLQQCPFLEDLELTPSFGDYHNARIARLSESTASDLLVLPLDKHEKLRRLSVPVTHVMSIKVGNRLIHYADESETAFNWDHLRHLAKVTGNNLRALDVENLPEQIAFLYAIPEMFPNLQLLATPSVFTVSTHLLVSLSNLMAAQY